VRGKTETAGDIHRVQYNTAQLLTDFKTTDFLNAVGGKYVLFDFDVRETTPGGEVLRSRGTKLRIRLKDLGELWKTIEDIEPV
jgi:hypothetical protein